MRRVSSREPADDAVEPVTRALEALGLAIDRPQLRFGASAIDAGAIADLRPEEAVAVAASVASRRAEFASGRTLLRRVLGVDVAVPVGADRRPVLPPDVTASVAHDADLVIVAVARDQPFTVGIDVERVGAVDRTLVPIVLRPDEPGIDPTLAFCAKEAVYKAWSMAGGRFLEHHDVRLSIVGPTVHAEVLAVGPDDPTVRIGGGWATTAGRYVVLVVAEPVGAR